GCKAIDSDVPPSHFLNCFLSSCPVPHPHQAADEEPHLPAYVPANNNRIRRLHRGNITPILPRHRQHEWANLTPKSLWSQIKFELKSYYDWELQATDAYNFYTTGQSKIQQGFLKDGYELISEALNLLNNVYGAMHPEIAQCLRMLARLNYIMGEHAEAMAYQQKAVLMSERVNGIGSSIYYHTNMVQQTHLALYCFANNQVSTALKLLYRARYLALLVCGENHPEIALLDSNISLILHAVGEYELSLRFLEKARDLNKKYYGDKSLKVAVSFHLVARTQSCMGDFRAALNNEKETYAIYKQQLGESHEKTRESSDCLRHLTTQAVVLQKKMNELYTGKGSAAMPPIQIQPPSMGSVLDMLNVINGILFVQISQQDIENFKAEIEKRQLKDSSPAPLEEKTENENREEQRDKILSETAEKNKFTSMNFEIPDERDLILMEIQRKAEYSSSRKRNS
ncbi:hypothetical protein L9F63_027948, partial [Diploptera punctata]